MQTPNAVIFGPSTAVGTDSARLAGDRQTSSGLADDGDHRSGSLRLALTAAREGLEIRQ